MSEKFPPNNESFKKPKVGIWKRVQKKFRTWFESRITPRDTVTLTQRNVYILPTRPGFMLAATLLVLLVASINYQLNLGYLLTFLLAGCAVVGMHVCHGTLRGLTMNLVAPEAHFALANASFTVKLTNARRSDRIGLGVAVLEASHEDRWAYTDVPGQGQSSVTVSFKPERRGLHRLPTLTAETRFPLGTFRVWTVWRPAAQMLVYPAPEPHAPPLPPGEPRAGGARTQRQHSAGEFDGVRAYRRGDPLKLVVWKQAAKAQARGSSDLVSRDTEQAQRHELWLDYTQAGGSDPERRISRLCAWVLQAEREGLDYGLRLPGITVKPSRGEGHKRQCLEALAVC